MTIEGYEFCPESEAVQNSKATLISETSGQHCYIAHLCLQQNSKLQSSVSFLTGIPFLKQFHRYFPPCFQNIEALVTLIASFPLLQNFLQ